MLLIITLHVYCSSIHENSCPIIENHKLAAPNTLQVCPDIRKPTSFIKPEWQNKFEKFTQIKIDEIK